MGSLPYSEGDWFTVPLRQGGVALGLVSRADGHGGVIGYFFGPKRWHPVRLDDAIGLSTRDALRVMQFGDLGLLGRMPETWPILGRLSDWDRDRWPLPDFCRRDISGKAYRVVYSDENLAGPQSEVEISDEECDKLPRDALSGAGAVERVLTHLLDPDAD